MAVAKLLTNLYLNYQEKPLKNTIISGLYKELFAKKKTYFCFCASTAI